MPSRNLEDLNTTLQDAYLYGIEQWAITYPNLPKPFITATYRSNDEQAILYASGRAKKGPILTNAKPGQSKHNKKPSEAFDIAFKNESGGLDWKEDLFTKFFMLIKAKFPMVIWGGNFKSIKDKPHFEI